MREAAKQEIMRRYLLYKVEYAKGLADKDTVHRAQMLMENLNLTPEDRRVVEPAREVVRRNKKSELNGTSETLCGAAIELKDGTIVTGKNSPLMDSASSLILNAIKTVSGIPDNIHLLSPNIIESIQRLKSDILKDRNVTLNLQETLIALSISATTNPTAEVALSNLKELAGCEVHFTHIQSPTDERVLKKLGLNVTCDPEFPSKNLFVI